MAEYSVVQVDDSRKEDFFRLHSVGNGFGWCFCVAWWVPTWEGWGERTAGQNRVLREELFYHHEYDGYLLYHGELPVGWCQAGPRNRLEKLCSQYNLEPDPEVWAITCFCIAPGYRGRNLAEFLLDEILKDLRGKRVERVEGYPRRGSGLGPGEVWTGPEPLFVKAGFELERDDPAHPVYLKYLQDRGR